MSRASYGADVFSPVRGNTSFNDDGLCVGREHDFLKNWQEPHGVTRNSEVKKKNLPFFSVDEVFSKDNLQSAIDIDRPVEKNNVKDLSSEADLNRLSFVTTRRCKSSDKSKKELGIIQESQSSVNVKVSKTRKKNYITVRPEADSNKELLPSKIKQNKNFKSCLVNSADSNKELLLTKLKQKDSSSSSINLADSKKDLFPSKIEQNEDSSLAVINSGDSKKELPDKNKKEIGIIQESQSSVNVKVSKTRKKNHITVRSEANSNKELPPSKIKQNKDFSSCLVNSADSSKELLPTKIKQKDSSLSSLNLADSKKDLFPSKIEQNEDSSLAVINSGDSNKKLPFKKITENKDSSTSSVNFADSVKETSSSNIKQNKDSLSSDDPADSNEDLFPTKIKTDKESSSPSLVSLAFNLDVNSSKPENNYPGLSEEQPKTHKVLTNDNAALMKNTSKSKKSKKDSKVPVEKCIEIEKPVFTSVCKGDILMLPGEVSPDKENREELTVAENFNAESTFSGSDSKSKQIQANIIEKLVKDAVSFEFDGIRQMLYLQHLQLLKYMDRNTVNCQLQKIIEELMEENTRLKSIIAQQNT